MYIVLNIFDQSNKTITSDIVCRFNIREVFSNGTWTYSMSENAEFEFKNEFRDELIGKEDEFKSFIRETVNKILNSEQGKAFVSNPVLRIAYDDETKKVVIL